jgi:hypothetical protein
MAGRKLHNRHWLNRVKSCTCSQTRAAPFGAGEVFTGPVRLSRGDRSSLAVTLQCIPDAMERGLEIVESALDIDDARMPSDLRWRIGQFQDEVCSASLDLRANRLATIKQFRPVGYVDGPLCSGRHLSQDSAPGPEPRRHVGHSKTGLSIAPVHPPATRNGSVWICRRCLWRPLGQAWQIVRGPHRTSLGVKNGRPRRRVSRSRDASLPKRESSARIVAK